MPGRGRHRPGSLPAEEPGRQHGTEIAAGLFVSVATVKAHISRILTKLGLGNRTQIALLAHDAGLA